MTLTTEETAILKSIKVASENNPHKPEFPADKPKFPATKTYKLNVPGFSNVWLKDESTNSTGTHKDRMAWEIVVTYRELLLAKKRGQIKKLPSMSLISSGSAAVAIQTQLAKYHLPNLHVLVDVNIAPDILNLLEAIGCEVYKTDLAKKPLDWQEILLMTNNSDGLDITSSEELDPTTRFYDWLSYEIINSSPDYCFVPFGTGHLYENILNINKREVSAKQHDRRFKGDTSKLQNCNFMGATTNNPKSKADKLYSPHLPFVHMNEQWLRAYKQSGYCGKQSNVFAVKEKCLDEAIALAKKLQVTAEPSGIAGLALLLQMKSKIPADSKILIVNTGKSRLSNKS